MLTLVPPSRLGSSLANAAIDMKRSDVFLCTFSALVTLWSTSFQHSSLLSSVLSECENTMKATCSTVFLWAGNQGLEKGVGSRMTGQGERVGSCHLNSLSLFYYPTVQMLHPFTGMAAVPLHSIRASSLGTFHFLICLRVSFWFIRNYWTVSEKGAASGNWN